MTVNHWIVDQNQRRLDAMAEMIEIIVSEYLHTFTPDELKRLEALQEIASANRRTHLPYTR